MANIHQDGHSIRYMQMVSSNPVLSTHLCEASKCRMAFHKKKLKKINPRVRYLALKIAFFWVLIMIKFQALNYTRLQKVKYLLNESSDLYKI